MTSRNGPPLCFLTCRRLSATARTFTCKRSASSWHLICKMTIYVVHWILTWRHSNMREPGRQEITSCSVSRSSSLSSPSSPSSPSDLSTSRGDLHRLDLPSEIVAFNQNPETLDVKLQTPHHSRQCACTYSIIAIMVEDETAAERGGCESVAQRR
jgi:hypothetical protein